MSECLVEVVHLGQNADGGQDHEDISRRVRKLVLSSKGKLQRDAKSLDRHDRDGANGRANGEVDESILAAVDGGDLVYHDDGENRDSYDVEQEPYKGCQ